MRNRRVRSDTGEPGISSLVLGVYLPTVLFSVGQGAVVPIIALSAAQYDASVALAAVAVAMRGIGTMMFDMPAGSLIARIGERHAMAVGTVILIAALMGCVLSPNIYLFLLSVFVLGCGWAVWLLARLSYVTERIPIHFRGRALSMLGGVTRIGHFIGPLIGAIVVATTSLNGAYVFHAVLAIVALVALVMVTRSQDGDHTGKSAHTPVPVLALVRENSHVLMTAGIGAMCLSILRSSRHAVLPLWGSQIGLSPAQVSVVFGISAAMDMTLFYPAGIVSDRIGRKFVAVPCLLLMSAGFMAVPFTANFLALALVGGLIGLGNGIGSGIVMTLGADFSPTSARASFLGVWRLITDAGQAAGPVLAGTFSALFTLGAASGLIGVIGVAGSAVFVIAMPETLTRLDPGLEGNKP